MANASLASPPADAAYAMPAYSGGAIQGAVRRVLTNVSAWQVALTFLLAILIYDQVAYVWRKGSIAGPILKFPIMGPFLESVNPKFEKYMEKWASGPLSCVSVFHKFVVIASTRDMSRKVFNSPMFVKPCVVDIAHKLLRPTNWVFLDGRDHVDYRKGLNGLFTRQALELYLPGMDETYSKYMQKFLEISQVQSKGQPSPFMPQFRELMTALSCRTFVGHYMSDDVVKKIADEYYKITAALELVNFPIILPFTKVWYGKKAADMALDEFAKCAAKSKVRMAAGGKPNCILDAWVMQMYASQKYREKEQKGIEVPQEEKPAMRIRMFSDFEISQTLFTFLFASQDASSSATTWLFQFLADRPEWLDKVREENLRLRNGDKNAPLTMDILEGMVETRAVVKETLRYRPPVLMVPYVVKKDFPITDKYTAPKGSMVVPATYPALHDPVAYPNPDSWEPERWVTGDADKQTKNWLVFGVGPHYCLGQTYAQYNLMAMMGKFSMHLDWKHDVTPLSEQIKFFCTIFPKDNCLLTFSKRS